MNVRPWRLSLTVKAALLACAVTSAGSRAAAQAIRFAPHRAVYEITLARTQPGSGIADLKGRMVYELTGGACKGYGQKFRYVSTATNQEGGRQTNDLRSETWEDGEGGRLRFSVERFVDMQLANSIKGRAERKKPSGRIGVKLTKPQDRSLSFPSDIYFPMQHSSALLRAAKRGDVVFSGDFYDGSENGDKIVQTSAVIGRISPPGSVTPPASLTGDLSPLQALPSWPIAIGFFEGETDEIDAVPVTEQTYRYYANGVATDLVTDYGEYTLRFDLTKLTFLDMDADCP